MMYLTESLRNLSNSLGLQARIIYMDISKECNINYDIARSRLPTAFFATVGHCKSYKDYSLTNEMMNDAANLARDYARPNAYLVFTLTNADSLSFPALDSLRYFIKVCHINTYRPVMISAAYDYFLKDTNLTYNDIIILGEKQLSKYSFNKVMDKIEKVLLPPQQFKLSMAELNEQLNSCPADPIKPLLFSQPSFQLIDCCVLLFFLYSLYNLSLKHRTAPKLKKG